MAPNQKYGHVDIKDNDRIVAHVIYSHQSLGGKVTMGEGRNEEDQTAIVIYGNLYFGEDGGYEIPFEVTVTDDGDEAFSLGETEFELSRGRCFLIDSHYDVRQLPFGDLSSALKQLM